MPRSCCRSAPAPQLGTLGLAAAAAVPQLGSPNLAAAAVPQPVARRQLLRARQILSLVQWLATTLAKAAAQKIAARKVWFRAGPLVKHPGPQLPARRVLPLRAGSLLAASTVLLMRGAPREQLQQLVAKGADVDLIEAALWLAAESYIYLLYNIQLHCFVSQVVLEQNTATSNQPVSKQLLQCFGHMFHALHEG